LRDGQAIAEGAFDVAALARVWPRNLELDALPAAFTSPEQLAGLSPPIVEALIGAEVIGIVSIASPRRRWGTLFGTSGLIEPTPADAPAVDAFAAQLALVLDAAALIEHTIAVERSLA